MDVYVKQTEGIKMKIYTINHDKLKSDAYVGHVIVANSEAEVRELVKIMSEKEGKAIWDSARVEVQGEYTNTITEPFIIMSEYIES